MKDSLADIEFLVDKFSYHPNMSSGLQCSSEKSTYIFTGEFPLTCDKWLFLLLLRFCLWLLIVWLYNVSQHATHSSTLAWKIPWTEEPGKLQSMRVAKSRTQLSDFTFTLHSHALEKEMATHSSVLAWRIPGMGEPGELPSMGWHRVGHDWGDLAAAAVWISLGLFSLEFIELLGFISPFLASNLQSFGPSFLH